MENVPLVYNKSGVNMLRKSVLMQISLKRSDKAGFLLQICFYGADHWHIFYLASSAEPKEWLYEWG